MQVFYFLFRESVERNMQHWKYGAKSIVSVKPNADLMNDVPSNILQISSVLQHLLKYFIQLKSKTYSRYTHRFIRLEKKFNEIFLLMKTA